MKPGSAASARPRRFVQWLVALLLLVCPAPPIAAAGDVATAMPEIAAAQLPKEARRTLDLVKAGGPFPYERDGIEFRNFERLLPQRGRGYYREYTVPTPGVRTRGARRIVAGGAGEYYYTADHYRSFSRIRE